MSFSSPTFPGPSEENEIVTIEEDGREWEPIAGMRDRRRTFFVNGKKFQTRRKKRWWTPKEDELLIYGVNKFGEGRWSEIRSFLHIKGRSTVDLKDRWRTMKRQGRVK